MAKVTDILPKITQWEAIPYAPDFECPKCGKCGISTTYQERPKPDLVGWCETYQGFMAVFECKECGAKYRFHPHVDKFNKEKFDRYLGIYYICGHSTTRWIANGEELKKKLNES